MSSSGDTPITSAVVVASLPTATTSVPPVSSLDTILTLPSKYSSSVSSTTLPTPSPTTGSGAPKIGWDDLDLPSFYGIGFFAHASLRGILFPMQVVKTREQTASAHGHKSYGRYAWPAIKSIARTEGIHSLWRGFLPSFGTIITGAPWATVMETSRKFYISRLPRFVSLDAEHTYFAASSLAGLTATATVVPLNIPLDIISQRQQVERNTATRRSARQIARSIWETEGIRGLWRGLPMAWMTQVPQSGITWGAYEALKQWTYPHFGTAGVPPAVRNNRDFWLGPLCACTAGSVSALITTPLDTLRTRQQVQEKVGTSLVSTWRDLMKQSGLRGLLAGMRPRVYQAAPHSLITLSAFDLIKRFSAKSTE